MILIALLAILLMTLQIRTGERPTILTMPVIYLYQGAHKLINQGVKQVNGVWNGYIWLIDAKDENTSLKKELNQLKELNNRYLEYQQENKRLRRLLEFKKESSMMVVPAQIISKDSSSWFKTLLIDKGSDDAVKKNQAVVTHQGIVGRTIEATGNASKVLLLTDLNSSVAVLIQRNRAEGIMIGSEQEECRIKYLPRISDVKVGDVVITSGLGGIFPKGLRVGEITQIKKKDYGLFQDARLQPYVKFSELEEVLIVR